ncbi:MAG TPA: hypothetical protein VGR52_00345 [Stellaceae bacterium]|nr:hypothetical protein [Stellaceae bacterium]
MTKRTLDQALSELLPPERRADVEDRARQAILDEARRVFLDAAANYCFEMRNAPPSVGPLGEMRHAYERMWLAWRESPEVERDRARFFPHDRQ